jgi:hypothetical protein
MDVLANLVQSAPPTDKSLPSFTGGFSGFCTVLYSTLLHLPLLRFYTVSEDAGIEPQGSCDFGIGRQTL